jgi:hypothetical protein
MNLTSSPERLAGPLVARKSPVLAATAVVLWILLSFGIFNANGRTIGSGDTVPASLVPVVVLLDGTVMLDRFTEEEHRRFARPYWLQQTRFGTTSGYPLATGILSIPIYAAPVLYQAWHQPLSTDEWRDFAVGPLQKLAASIFAALSVGVFWSICVSLGFRSWLPFILTALYAFGSETYAISSQALWQHGPGSLALLCAIRGILASGKRPRMAALVVGLSLGLAVAIRDNNLFLAGPIGLAALYRQPRLWLWFMAPAVAIVVPVSIYNHVVLGSILAVGQGQIGGLALRNMREGLPGVFFSPSRGIFLYFPAAALALVLVLRHASALSREPLFLALGACIILATGLNASYKVWYGGDCFGPRYFTEVQGPILILLGAAIEAGGRRLAPSLCLMLILPYSIFIQVMGSWSTATIDWNAEPRPGEVSRNWDWNDNPIFRGIRANL